MLTKLLTTSGILIGISGILLTFAGDKALTDQYFTLSGGAYKYILYLGLGGFYLGIAFLLAATVVWIVSKVPHGAAAVYRADRAAEHELADLHKYCSKAMPGTLAPLGVWKDRYRKNHSLFYIVRKTRSGFLKHEEVIAGSFSLIPISKDAQARLDAGQISGVDLLSKDVVSQKDKPAAIYLSWVVASGFQSKSHTLTLLNEKLRDTAKKGSIDLYTKPSTPDGLRLSLQHGFVPVHPTLPLNVNMVCKHRLVHGSLTRTAASRHA